MPYYNRKKEIMKWECFSDHNMAKYVALSNDNVEMFLHTPNKTLIYVVHLPDVPAMVNNAADYMAYYIANNHQLTLSARNYDSFGRAVILNDYESFIDKVYHTVKAL